MTFVIANSQADFSGVQGQKGWFNGYHVYNPVAGIVDYDPNQAFIPFPGGQDLGVGWDGSTQTWDGWAWDLNTDGPPWTYVSPLSVYPNAADNPPGIGIPADPTNEQWATRRWVASALTSNTPVTIIWSVKENLANQGVSGLLFINGHQVDKKSIIGNDGVGETRRYRTTLKKSDIVDLALSPESPDGNRNDWSDASQTWFWVDARPLPPADITLSAPFLDVALGKFSFKWNSAPGYKYNVMSSPDLKTWSLLEAVDSGERKPPTRTRSQHRDLVRAITRSARNRATTCGLIHRLARLGGEFRRAFHSRRNFTKAKAFSPRICQRYRTGKGIFAFSPRPGSREWAEAQTTPDADSQRTDGMIPGGQGSRAVLCHKRPILREFGRGYDSAETVPVPMSV